MVSDRTVDEFGSRSPSPEAHQRSRIATLDAVARARAAEGADWAPVWNRPVRKSDPPGPYLLPQLPPVPPESLFSLCTRSAFGFHAEGDQQTLICCRPIKSDGMAG